MVWGIEIQNFNSTGIYFQHIGPVKLSNGNIQFSNILDLSALEQSVRNLNAAVNAYEGFENAKNTKHFVEDLEKLLKTMKTESDNFKHGMGSIDAVLQPNIRREVESYINLSSLAYKDLKNGKLPVDNMLHAMKNMFENFASIVNNDNFNPKLLSKESLKATLSQKNYNLNVDETYRKLSEIGEVTKFKIYDGRILIVLTIRFFEDETYNLWKLIGVPIIHNKNVITVENNFKYLVASSDKILATSSDLSKIPNFKGVGILNTVDIDLVTLGESTCIFNIYKNERDFWQYCQFNNSFDNIEIFQNLGNYRYLFAIRDTTSFTYTCPELYQNIGTNQFIQGTGILTLNEGCHFKTMDTDLRALKVHVVIEPQDKFEVNKGLERMIQTLKGTVFLEPPLLTPLTKLTSNFDDFNDRSRKIESLQKEADDILHRINNRPMPTRKSKYF